MSKLANNINRNLIFIIILSGFFILSTIEYLQIYTTNGINFFKSEPSNGNKKGYPIPFRDKKQDKIKDSSQNESMAQRSEISITDQFMA